jgi:hypothetical protein
LKLATFPPVIGSNSLPSTLTEVPTPPLVGVNPVIVGAPWTVNGWALAADPFGFVTVMGPVVAPAGTVATICVEVAEVTDPATPLKASVVWLAVGLKPVPVIVTVVPSGPRVGVNVRIDTSPAPRRRIWSRLPTAS